jgi:hypothetical protein
MCAQLIDLPNFWESDKVLMHLPSLGNIQVFLTASDHTSKLFHCVIFYVIEFQYSMVVLWG